MKQILGMMVVAIALLGGARVSNASLVHYSVHLDGPSESPPNGSPGTGFASITYDNSLHTITMDLQFSGLLGTTTASHIHAATAVANTGTAGVATTTPFFTGFPIGVTSGTFHTVLDLTQASSYNPTYVTANGSVAASEVALTSAMAAGKAYLNIHTSVVPGGEIRGFTPEPSTLTLLGVAAVALIRRRRA